MRRSNRENAEPQSFQHFQQPRAAFFLAVRMDLFLSVRVFLSLDLGCGWAVFRLELGLYLVCKHMHLHPHPVVGADALGGPRSTHR